MKIARMKLARWIAVTSLPLLMITAVGCQPADMEARSSLHEDQHRTPPHWPENLADAVAKLHSRKHLVEDLEASPEERAAAFTELRDLVAWLPEVAAETELSEAEWLPIYESAERLSAMLRRTDLAGSASPFSPSLTTQLQTLCRLAARAAESLPESDHDTASRAGAH